MGLSLFPVLIGATFAAGCFWRLTTLPKVKGTTRKRLAAEQALFKDCHIWQQTINKVRQTMYDYQNYLKRQNSVLQNIIQIPERYSNQIDLYRRNIKCVEDYLSFCERAIEQHEAAINAALLQVETSKLGVELSANFVNPRIEFGLDLLQKQLQNNLPPKFADYGSNDDHPTC